MTAFHLPSFSERHERAPDPEEAGYLDDQVTDRLLEMAPRADWDTVTPSPHGQHCACHECPRRAA